MFLWIYHFPTYHVVLLFAAAFIAFNWIGVIFIRPFLRIFFRKQDGMNDVTGYVLSLFSVMYGLLVGMLAIVAYQALANAQEIADREAASIAALYRDVDSYPEPNRSTLTNLLKSYTRNVIDESWPLQREGIIPSRNTQRVTVLQSQFASFEPQTKGQEILHAEALRQFNEFAAVRRMRLSSVGAGGIPPIMWYTVITGAVICMSFVWLFDSTFVAQLILGGLASLAMSSMICLIVLMDNPFRGELSVSSAPYQTVYDQLMSNDRSKVVGESPQNADQSASEQLMSNAQSNVVGESSHDADQSASERLTSNGQSNVVGESSHGADQSASERGDALGEAEPP